MAAATPRQPDARALDGLKVELGLRAPCVLARGDPTRHSKGGDFCSERRTGTLQKLDFFGSRLASENCVAMREPAEARDDVVMAMGVVDI